MTKEAKTFSSIVSMVSGILLAVAASASGQQLMGRGQWQSLSGGEHVQGTWSVQLDRSGTRVEGTMALTGSNVLTGGSVHGTIDGQSVILGVSSDGVAAATFSGRLSGEAISGEWECAVVKDEGVWSGTLTRAK
jgi:hypothetical protein